jgi:predicted ATPase
MATSRKRKRPEAVPRRGRDAISRVTISGYKSVGERQTLNIGPLTILAGANSSGKSSLVQPLLLLKQTLEATYDPGPLLINGPNVKFTTSEQLFSKCSRPAEADVMEIGVEFHNTSTVTTRYSRQKRKIQIDEMRFGRVGEERPIRLDMPSEDLRTLAPAAEKNFLERAFGGKPPRDIAWRVVRNRCFLEVGLSTGEHGVTFFRTAPSDAVSFHIRELIHLPGLRGNPERTYPVSAVGATFPGTFDKYAASVIAKWETERHTAELRKVGQYLESLGLTWKVATEAVDETQVQVKVGRLPHATRGGAHDLVNIADVGVGTSQALPIVVALVVARPGQIVYIEQPEIHLHPAAQARLAEVFADAARRGVRVVIETHSSILLLAIQTIVATGRLASSDVKLHWFTRDQMGATHVAVGELDEMGAFGDWPEDFGRVLVGAEAEYVEAAISRLRNVS